MAFYLYLNTGSLNHGCEAIIRSTCKILDNVCGKQKKVLASSNAEQDKRFYLDELVEIIPSGIWKSQLHRGFYYIMRKVLKDSKLGIKGQFREFLREIQKYDVTICIGGDTYCYDYPEYLEVCLEQINKVGAKAVLWGTSIEPSKMSERLIKHLNQYDYIVVREEISYQALLNKGISQEKILKTCDPAFHLPIEKINLPEKFDPQNTIGLNLSGFVTGIDTKKTQNAFETVCICVQELLKSTKYQICLIPHVYGKGAYGKDDLYYAMMLYDRIPVDMKPRISIIQEELSCIQLKYIISQCRFFIGARTHSMIAAYSSEVPAIALGYSVKADGIATDLFGTTENFVLNIEELQDPKNLKNAFSYLVNNETLIRENYKKKLPGYKDSILQATRKILLNEENSTLNEV